MNKCAIEYFFMNRMILTLMSFYFSFHIEYNNWIMGRHQLLNLTFRPVIDCIVCAIMIMEQNINILITSHGAKYISCMVIWMFKLFSYFFLYLYLTIFVWIYFVFKYSILIYIVYTYSGFVIFILPLQLSTTYFNINLYLQCIF
jgi:hypothetical protein